MDEKLQNLLDEMEHPFFLYDLDFLDSHLKKLKTDVPDFLTVFFACKANPLRFILESFKNNNFGIDVASQGEIDQAKYVGFAGENIIATGPAKSPDYLNYLLEQNVSTIVLESINQAKWLNQVSEKRGVKTKALIRFQLDWSKIKNEASVLGGSAITPFGLAPEDWQVLDLSTLKNIEVIGTHIFQWGNMLDEQELEFIWDHCLKESTNLAKSLNFKLDIVDLGGGIGLDYENNQSNLSFLSICQKLDKIRQGHGIPKIWMELGRYAVGECGSYFTQIIDIKKVRGKNLIIVEGGINQLARPALTGESFPCRPILKENSSSTNQYEIHGPLCTALDKLGSYQFPDSIKIGDWLKFDLCGAYGFTESMPFFLGHSLPGEVIFSHKKYKIVRHPESARSYLKI